ncbi:MAG: hypothetical protein IPJ88_06400 [Myxococcales bacterium]|nr:MAG: hypothetical protein IPJ88_06400 [Myxococcales bacterium]
MRFTSCFCLGIVLLAACASEMVDLEDHKSASIGSDAECNSAKEWGHAIQYANMLMLESIRVNNYGLVDRPGIFESILRFHHRPFTKAAGYDPDITDFTLSEDFGYLESAPWTLEVQFSDEVTWAYTLIPNFGKVDVVAIDTSQGGEEYCYQDPDFELDPTQCAQDRYHEHAVLRGPFDGNLLINDSPDKILGMLGPNEADTIYVSINNQNWWWLSRLAVKLETPQAVPESFDVDVAFECDSDFYDDREVYSEITCDGTYDPENKQCYALVSENKRERNANVAADCKIDEGIGTPSEVGRFIVTVRARKGFNGCIPYKIGFGLGGF